ncbi:GIY-YIG nuclease family protein [Janthinobacterium agaricidamnosum]|uniref:GIY-YIG domain-containing protein n=1 Tax=Janthinobacterium agaricidamnosum NBRC 102515 = DSM 9628 TaxID=1349767 RepID=W0V6E8_9BURK|nr:GIY-YIG nuclease family protein [Janthinobacterium agaricidamnosum]CDG82847.1 hypothetical protein GJA_2212 [Janthinobacterium agaricidamnosum NBRC 102515 = DSM 9628]
MNEEFETLPFAAEWNPEADFEEEFELQDERGRRPGPVRGAAGRARGGGRPLPLRKPVPRRRPPFFGPYYGGAWPYGALPPAPVAEPFPYPGPQPGPYQDQDQDQDRQSGEQDETPATLSDTLARIPASQRPDYQLLGPIADAVKDERTSGGGLYLIEFTSNGQPRAYSGQTGDLRRRLRQHVLCGQMMGLPMGGHRVYIAPLAKAGPRRSMERRIHRDMLTRHKGVLTNQRQELEMQLLGRDWL